MNDPTAAEFDKVDIILAEALEKFQAEGINQFVFGTALLEIGVTALAKVGEPEDKLVETVRLFWQRAGGLP